MLEQAANSYVSKNTTRCIEGEIYFKIKAHLTIILQKFHEEHFCIRTKHGCREWKGSKHPSWQSLRRHGTKCKWIKKKR